MAADVTPTLDIMSNPMSDDPGAAATDTERWKSELEALGLDGEPIIADLDALKAALAADGGGRRKILAKLGRSAAADGDLGLQTLDSRLSSFGT